MREELHFKDHKLSEWENLLRTEREKVKSLEHELEVNRIKLALYNSYNITRLLIGYRVCSISLWSTGISRKILACVSINLFLISEIKFVFPLF